MEGGGEQGETKKPSTFNKSAQNRQQLFARFALLIKVPKTDSNFLTYFFIALRLLKTTKIECMM
jgi:hypothetical protein